MSNNLEYNDATTRANKKTRATRFVCFLVIGVLIIGISCFVVWNQVNTQISTEQARETRPAPQEDIDRIIQHMNQQYSRHFTYIEGSGSQYGGPYLYTSIRCKDEDGNECGVSSAIDTWSNNPTEKFEDDYQVIVVNQKGTDIVKSLMPNITSGYYHASYMGKTGSNTRYYTDPGQVFDDRNYDVTISAHLSKSSNTDEFCQKVLAQWPNAYARVFVTGEDANGYTSCNIEYKVENGKYFITKENRYDTSNKPVFSYKPSS